MELMEYLKYKEKQFELNNDKYYQERKENEQSI